MSKLVVGIDFGDPARAAAQRRKILAVVARKAGPRSYVVSPEGLNERLLRRPRLTASDLADRDPCWPALPVDGSAMPKNRTESVSVGPAVRSARKGRQLPGQGLARPRGQEVVRDLVMSVLGGHSFHYAADKQTV